MYISTLLFPDLVMSGFFQEPQTFPSLGMPRSSADRKWLGIMRENFDPQASKFTRAPYSSWASGAEPWSGSLKFWPANSVSASPKGPGGICRGISWLFNGGMLPECIPWDTCWAALLYLSLLPVNSWWCLTPGCLPQACQRATGQQMTKL